MSKDIVDRGVFWKRIQSGRHSARSVRAHLASDWISVVYGSTSFNAEAKLSWVCRGCLNVYLGWEVALNVPCPCSCCCDLSGTPDLDFPSESILPQLGLALWWGHLACSVLSSERMFLLLQPELGCGALRHFFSAHSSCPEIGGWPSKCST